MSQPFDEKYWGPGGVDVSLWGNECQRGCQYQVRGTAPPAGTKGQVRKISTGRKERGSSADSYDHLVARWQKLTGKDATLDGDGRTFAEVAEARRA